MFINFTPYLTWLSIMLTSKPHDLQNRLNILNNGRGPPATTTTIATTTHKVTTSTSPVTTSTEIVTVPDFFICRGRPNGRYPHSWDCTKYFVCTGDHEIVPPKLCPNNLHFSPIVHLCTLPKDAGCVVETTLDPTQGNVSSNSSLTSATARTTPFPTGSNWLVQIQQSRYYKAVEEDRLVIYYDRDVANPQSIIWPIAFTRDLWENIINMYGDFGESNRLYLVLRGRKQSSMLNYASYLDSSKGYLNTIEVGSSDWSMENADNTDLIVTNLAHIVTNNARGIRYPGPEPGWANIFTYDLYQRVNRSEDRNRWEAKVKFEEENNIASIPMFGLWYLPIYQMYGGGAVLNRFLALREQHFPKNEQDNSTFARIMNRGEFVHFWRASSGANNLVSLATFVFGWSTSLSDQYEKARTDFSSVV